MTDDESPSGFDSHAAVVAMLALRINTPVGEWLSDEDAELFWRYVEEGDDAEDDGDASEGFLLEMMNTSHYALGHLALLTGKAEQEWLQQIALETRPRRAAWIDD